MERTQHLAGFLVRVINVIFSTFPEYTNYIHALQDILTDAQGLILHLSKGYRTATRVDHEWRDKMRKVLVEVGTYLSTSLFYYYSISNEIRP